MFYLVSCLYSQTPPAAAQTTLHDARLKRNATYAQHMASAAQTRHVRKHITHARTHNTQKRGDTPNTARRATSHTHTLTLTDWHARTHASRRPILPASHTFPRAHTHPAKGARFHRRLRKQETLFIQQPRFYVLFWHPFLDHLAASLQCFLRLL